jgi:hypothetical protein
MSREGAGHGELVSASSSDEDDRGVDPQKSPTRKGSMSSVIMNRISIGSTTPPSQSPEKAPMRSVLARSSRMDSLAGACAPRRTLSSSEQAAALLRDFYDRLLITGCGTPTPAESPVADQDPHRIMSTDIRPAIVSQSFAPLVSPMTPTGRRRPRISAHCDMHCMVPVWFCFFTKSSRAPESVCDLCGAVFKNRARTFMPAPGSDPRDMLPLGRLACQSGQVARVLLYTIVRYGRLLSEEGRFMRMIRSLAKTSIDHPPTYEEQYVNSCVAAFQGNHNPFVSDHAYFTIDGFVWLTATVSEVPSPVSGGRGSPFERLRRASIAVVDATKLARSPSSSNRGRGSGSAARLPSPLTEH